MDHRNIFCLSEPSLCLILFAGYSSLFITIRYWLHRQFVIAYPTIQVSSNSVFILVLQNIK